MSSQNSSAPADDRPSHNDGAALQLPVELDATETEYSHPNAPQYKIQGLIPVQRGDDLVVDLSDLTQAGDWYVDTDVDLYIRGKRYTQGTPDSRYVKVQAITTERPGVASIGSRTDLVSSTDLEESLEEIEVSTDIPEAAVTDLVDSYAFSATEVVKHTLLDSHRGIVDLLAHSDGTRVSVDVQQPYEGWKHDVSRIKDKHQIEALDPDKKEHMRAMVRPVLGAAWGDGEYEARVEAPDPDLDRLYELADGEGYTALTRV
ncbi:hypothetical protein [Halorubrum sp. BV1]|uniref:hypothetical protein n=1 Tax=Halorubrum sp. BV1 TaxID=1498500 RepID=UPI000678B7AE|nr:hypothetical protein [Halorubrum sp. BV1]